MSGLLDERGSRRAATRPREAARATRMRSRVGSRRELAATARPLRGNALARRLVLACILLGIHGAGRIASADDAAPPGHLLQVVGGLGYTFDDEKDRSQQGGGRGGFLEAEYVFRPFHIFTPRLYAGGLVTFPDENSCGGQPCDVQSKIFFAGAKLRATAPIPYVAPFVELGLGASVGYLRTLNQALIDETTRGVAVHVPVAIGLSVGRRHEYDVAFSYLFHPEQHQFGGAIAVGIGFALP